MGTVKTAISIQKSLFEQAEELAHRMKVSRSHLFSIALEDYIRRLETRTLIEQINEVYEDDPAVESEEQNRAIRRQMRRVLQDKW